MEQRHSGSAVLATFASVEMAFALSSKAQASVSRASKAPRTRSVKVQAAALPSYLPGSVRPAHLDGTLAGDFGFDPLGLGKDPEALKWYVQAELIHCRTAMTAVAGILIPSVLTKAGILSVPEWYEAGKVYAASPNAIPTATLNVVMMVMYHFVEVKRWQDFRKPKSQAEKGTFFGFEASLEGKENAYPGGPFDPLGLSRGSAESYADYKLKEVKNGRLAMLALLGFAAQYYATGKGPLDNLAEHLSDPFHKNFAENAVSIPFF